jgi:curved DNA-binding protein CbpA
VPVDADLAAIRTAYRSAVKKCHPDRFAHLDEEFQELATRKVKQLRRAYDSLVRRLED